jgi:hypothetical protein
MTPCDLGEGDVDRAIRQALVGLWISRRRSKIRAVSRWDRNEAGFDRISKMAQAVAEG